ncbi:MAG: HEAT repeat domain-containing protein [Bradymonadia bacterium]
MSSEADIARGIHARQRDFKRFDAGTPQRRRWLLEHREDIVEDTSAWCTDEDGGWMRLRTQHDVLLYTMDHLGALAQTGDAPEAVDLLGQIAAKLPLFEGRAPSKDVGRVLFQTIKGIAHPFNPEQQKLFLEASAREAIYGWGNHLWLTLAALPLSHAQWATRIQNTTFDDFDSAVPYQRWLLQHIVGPDGLAFEEALVPLYASVRNSQRQAMTEAWAQLDRAGTLAPTGALLAPAVRLIRALPFGAQGTLAAGLAEHTAPEQIAPVLEWLLREGHPKALPAVIDAIAQVGTAECAPALSQIADADFRTELRASAAKALDAVAVRAPLQLAPDISALLEGRGDPGGLSFEVRQRAESTWLALTEASPVDAETRSQVATDLMQIVERWQQQGAPYPPLTYVYTLNAVLGHEAFEPSEHTLRAQLTIITSDLPAEARIDALIGLRTRALHGQARLDSDQREMLLRELSDPDRQWTTHRRHQLATLALPESLEQWRALHTERARDDALAHFEHSHLLSLTPTAELRSALAFVYQQCTPTQRRGLLKTLTPEHAIAEAPGWLPVWLGILDGGAPATRQVVGDALIQVQQPGTDGAMQTLIDGETELDSKAIAVRVLGAVFDRTQLPWLYALVDRQPQLRKPAQAAIEHVQARHPVEGDHAGQLAVAEHQAEAGALSEAEAHPTASTQTTAHGPQRERYTLSRPELPPIERLPVAPRKLPLGLWLAYLTLGNNWWGILWVTFPGIFAWGFAADGAIKKSQLNSVLWGAAFFLAGWLVMHAMGRTWHSLIHLKNGTPATGRLKSKNTRRTGRGQNASTTWYYTLEYLTEAGKVHTFTLSFGAPRPQLESQGEPILYTSTADGTPRDQLAVDALRLIVLTPDGHLRTRKLALFWTASALLPWGLMMVEILGH